MEPAYPIGPDRVRRIRIALGVTIALGLFCGIFAVLFIAQADTDAETVGVIVLGVIAAATTIWPFLTWRMLETPDRNAKRAVVVTGVLLILSALPTFGLFGIGLIFVVLGMVLIFLAMVSEAGAET